MTYDEFRETLSQSSPPDGANDALKAMWYDAQGDWTQAHSLAQAQDDADGAWVHAYLHRVEGDLANAGYWYRRANRPTSTASLEDEWASIVEALLAK